MLRNSGGGRFAGVLGWPLDHTLSPVIHNAAFRRAGIDCTYLAFAVAPEDLGAAVTGLRALRALGANVTMPHKEAIGEFLDELTEDSDAVGAVNTVECRGSMLIGHNTDVAGFAAFLTEDAGYQPAGRRCAVLGAGGAARAVVRALHDLGAAEIAVVGRNRDRAERVAELAETASAVPWEGAAETVSGAECIVNATPLGASGENPAAEAAFRRGQIVCDLIYAPPTTPLVDAARRAGADAWGGLGMLVHQAAASFAIWTGLEAPIDAMSAAAVHAIGSTRP